TRTRIPQDRVGRSSAVRDAGSVAEVHDAFARQSLSDRTNDGKSSQARIENPERSVAQTSSIRMRRGGALMKGAFAMRSMARRTDPSRHECVIMSTGTASV